mmetsp:Transcript_35833/g.85806  ORF Transcript_35833/g.85806 Transcript_35833/m.85806 type:complete len:294 (+) Transcript_35833:153-1034(+)
MGPLHRAGHRVWGGAAPGLGAALPLGGLEHRHWGAGAGADLHEQQALVWHSAARQGSAHTLGHHHLDLGGVGWPGVVLPPRDAGGLLCHGHSLRGLPLPRGLHRGAGGAGAPGCSVEPEGQSDLALRAQRHSVQCSCVHELPGGHCLQILAGGSLRLLPLADGRHSRHRLFALAPQQPLRVTQGKDYQRHLPLCVHLGGSGGHNLLLPEHLWGLHRRVRGGSGAAPWCGAVGGLRCAAAHIPGEAPHRVFQLGLPHVSLQGGRAGARAVGYRSSAGGLFRPRPLGAGGCRRAR